MPYITKERKTELNKTVSLIVNESFNSIGEINYVITMLIKSYINKFGISYRVLNESIGVLECAKLELYRRLVSVYEDVKIAENGDVYE